MTTPPAPPARLHIHCALAPDAAVITRRAAARLQLPVHDQPDGSFIVELRDAIDAYRLAEQTTSDPAWAMTLAGMQARKGRQP